MSKPETTEYGEWYAGYISLVPENNIIDALNGQIKSFSDVMAKVPTPKGEYAYAEGKWSIKEILGHINDAERIFAYRALRIARGDTTPLPGFEQDGYIATGRFNGRDLSDLSDEFVLLRRSNMKMFDNLLSSDFVRSGIASDNPISVRAIAYIMVGHVRHHLNILETRYLA